ncbi:hypothetical protein THRCLA_21040 [Thraustotheca clavata]|uniref:Secreted protein n=1 Tax=Thraustotheca clavata TaxID=74557 RepID=A0A1W0A0N6_9STRA|nr:hypothetical protein THRCLA_21040 [Thraustotheca clavata]
MRIALFFGLIALAVADHGGSGLGSMTKKRVTPTATKDLYLTLENEAHYPNENTLRVCTQKILSVSEQVVSGTNYLYHVRGCVVDDAENAAKGCSCDGKDIAEYEIKTYVQSWTGTYKVNSVSKLSSHSSTEL